MSENTLRQPADLRAFAVLWLSQAVLLFGNALTLFANTVFMAQVMYPEPAQRVQLGAGLAAAGVAWTLPSLVLGPLAGAWVDRNSRKATMIVSSIASLAVLSLLVAHMAQHTLTLSGLVLMMTTLSALNAFHTSGFETSYVMLVPTSMLPRANGMVQGLWAVSGICAPLVAAWLIRLPAAVCAFGTYSTISNLLGSMPSGAPVAVAANLVASALAVLLLAFVRIPPPTQYSVGQTTKRLGLGEDLRSGVRHILARPPLVWLLVLFALCNLVGGAMGTLQPLIVGHNLLADRTARALSFEASLALLASVMSVGGLIGSLAMTLWGGVRRNRAHGVLVPLMGMAIAQAAYGYSKFVYITLAAGFVISFMSPIMNSHSQTIWQIETPYGMQGRVFSIRRLVAQFTLPIGTAMGGYLGGRFDPGVVLMLMSLAVLSFYAAQLRNPHLVGRGGAPQTEAMQRPGT